MDFKLPDIGEGLTEGEITRWIVSEGQSVTEGEDMVEVMTDKATVTITCPADGVIAKLHAAEGAVVPVESVIVTIDTNGAAAGGAAAPAARAAHAGGGSAPAATAGTTATATAPPKRGNGKVLATPATRRKAREMGLDISTVPGTGPRGRVTKADLQRAAAGGGTAAPAPAPAPVPAPVPAPIAAVTTAPVAAPTGPDYSHLLPEPGQTERRVALRGMRKKIAEHLVHSKHTAPHFTYIEEIDCTELVQARSLAKGAAAAQGVKLTFLPYIIKALCSGFRVFPMLNASLDDARGEIVYKGTYNIGIATDTPAGLMVPVVKQADRRSLLDLAREIHRVASDARAGTSAIEDLRDGTFTITSAGSIGGVMATPILNHPEVAILGVNKIEERPVVRDGAIVIRHMTYMAIALDHRVVDGAHAAYFMNHVKRLLENPSLLLLEL